MPPAPPGLTLLLMAGLAFAATPPATLESWRRSTTNVCSSPDHQQQQQNQQFYSYNNKLEEKEEEKEEEEERRPVGELLFRKDYHCPPPCPVNSTKSTQCLYYLKESHKEEVCGADLGAERRRDVLHGLRMRHCCEHAVDQALPEAAFHSKNECHKHLHALIMTDMIAARISCEHAEVLNRYDCAQTYSIANRCHHCKQAYRRWVCSSLVPHYKRAGERVLPCLSVCQDVEQQCPYLLPGDWTNQTVPGEVTAHPTPQYAGEPTFLCLDPNIPETGEQRAKSSRGDEDCCYTHCGSPGRGGSVGGVMLGVCEHCPGRPTTLNTTTTTNKMVASRASILTSPLLSRTCYKVSLLWTAWIISKTFYRLVYEHKHKILLNTIKCLLVLCAAVRTTLQLLRKMNQTWTKTKCETCS